jgi:hypothetical protein
VNESEISLVSAGDEADGDRITRPEEPAIFGGDARTVIGDPDALSQRQETGEILT